MKYALLALILTFTAGACSTISTPKKSLPLTLISFEDVNRIKLGQDTKSTLLTAFGNPEKEIPISPTEYAVFYFGATGDGSFQRASFVISKESNLVLNASWNPNKNDSLNDIAKTKKYFSNAKFNMVKHGLIAHHEYSDNITLTDRSMGVSIDMNQRNNTVNSISLSLPEARRPAVAPK